MNDAIALRAWLAERRAELRDRHLNGESGRTSAAAMCGAAEQVVIQAWTAACGRGDASCLADLEKSIALVAVGGFGRAELSPYSDVDLIILVAPATAESQDQCIRTTVRWVWDAGLALGQNVATVKQILQQSRTDATLGTGLLSARLLWGSPYLFEELQLGFRQRLKKSDGAKIEELTLVGLAEERSKFGATAHLSEPNVKRSSGGLRHLQLVRWMGLIRAGFGDYAELEAAGMLGRGDAQVLDEAYEFLLRLRAELHFKAGKCNDALTRPEQIRIAAEWGYRDEAGAFAVESFMRDCLRRTTSVEEIVERFLDRHAAPVRRWSFLSPRNGREVAPNLTWNGNWLEVSPGYRESLATSLVVILDAASHAVSQGGGFDPATVEALRRSFGPAPPEAHRPTREESAAFLRFLGAPGARHVVLRQLFHSGVLERLLPEFGRVRCLIQFNAYHQYTVDEHTFIALQKMEELADPRRTDSPAIAYRKVVDRSILHLAMLLHDLGKGFDEDHSEVGMRIAHAVADRLHLSAGHRRVLAFLVHKHLLLSRLAFHRDTRDPHVLLELVRSVGREDALHMLYALTVADVTAVNPQAYTQWKADLLADLYHRARAWFGGADAGVDSAPAETRRKELAAKEKGPEAKRWIASLPVDYLCAATTNDCLRHIGLWKRLDADPVGVDVLYVPESDKVVVTVLAKEKLTQGVFHKICGALAAHRLEVLSAQIHTLADSTVLDVFEVRDVHHTGPTSSDRQNRIASTVRKVLLDELSVSDALWSNRSSLFVPRSRVIPAEVSRVEIDNASSMNYSIIDVFTHDRRGLLFTVARAIFELGLSVGYAKIATYEDEVVDVFYVRESDGCRIGPEERCIHVCEHIAESIRRLATDPRSMGF